MIQESTVIRFTANGRQYEVDEALIDYSMTRQSSRFQDMYHIRLINGSSFNATNVEEVRVLTATRNTGGKAWQ
ncbi:hypothetical protein ACM3VI_000493 [Escherichia coli]|uniref:hypothetical protein n=1 Tax=Escherichia coli TaxID=562 RepID=UPI0002A3B85A|nr:hypothetical protein [Escherichia coli]EER4873484.1 hypothetical protein [Escherichia coli]EET5234249.1 hypothetical protein [Escherichia coli]EEU5008805.1 hypothetical protein [Escherichia coli]EEV1981021.1 hypothetical protein [Escherichia coli]EEV6687610.1 hypothetical protein [Escherichia coli]